MVQVHSSRPNPPRIMQGRSRGILALLTPTVDARATSSSFRATTLATTFGRFGPIRYPRKH